MFLSPTVRSWQSTFIIVIVVVQHRFDEFLLVLIKVLFSFQMLLDHCTVTHLGFWVGGGHALLVSLLGNLGGDLDADVLDLGEGRVHPAQGEVLLRHQLGQSLQHGVTSGKIFY